MTSEGILSSEIEIVPTVGWANIRLGQPIQKVRSAMAELGFPLQVMKHDKYAWCSNKGKVTFQFVDKSSPTLASINLRASPMIVGETDLLGLRIDEALVLLKIKSYADTMWSIKNAADDFVNGMPKACSQHDIDCGTIDLLSCGTLWIHSLGLGLGMSNTYINRVTIRDSRNTPKVGCGSITQEMLITVCDHQFESETPDALNTKNIGSTKPIGLLTSLERRANDIVSSLCLTRHDLAKQSS